MLRYVARRFLFMIPLFFGITIICFSVMHLAPGSPTDLQTEMNPRVTAEMKERLRAMYDLDKPLHVQYGKWLGRLLVLDLGVSFSPDGRPVSAKILERLPITVFLNVLSMALIFLIAIPIGVLSAVRQGSTFDRVMSVIVFMGFAIPTFWLALLLMILFGIHLDWLPISGIRSLNYEYLPPAEAFWDFLKHLILPVSIAAFGGLAGLSRYMRSNMLEVIRQDYITTARAKGLSERVVIYKHALRNALIPFVTVAVLTIPAIFAGAIITETVFAWPGMGRLFYDALTRSDWPVALAFIFITAVLTVFATLLGDILYTVVDPRIKYT